MPKEITCPLQKDICKERCVMQPGVDCAIRQFFENVQHLVDKLGQGSIRVYTG